MTSTTHDGLEVSAERSSLERLSGFFAWAALASCFAVSRPYRGIVGDSVLYMGRGLASLDPDGVGRDPMWILDGQMQFSVFPKVAYSLIALLGVANAAIFLAGLGLALWVAALISLARAIGDTRSTIAIVLVCAAFPAAYNAYGSIYFGESIATPRVFAEAGALSALAALFSGRRALAVAVSAATIVVHPIMALAGVATMFVYVCLEDRRWLWLAASAACLGAAGAMLGVPVLERATFPVDSAWLAMLRGPADYLFPTTWPEAAWQLKAVQASTVALAICVCRGAVRRLFAAVLIASVGAMAITLAFGDFFPLLLIVQLQVWRVTWLLALAAAMAFAICAMTLWKEGPQSRFVLALLAIAWIVNDTGLGALLAAFVLLMKLGRFDASNLIGAAALRWVWIGVAGLVLLKTLVSLGLALSFSAADAAGVREPAALLLLDAHILAIPVALAAICFALAPMRLRPGVALLGNIAICVLALSLWRQEWDPYRVTMARAGRQEDLARMIGSRSGPVLWLGGNQEAWYWLGRANWAAGIQGNGVVFSRELTMLWFERMRVLSSLGWIADGGTVPRTLSKPDPVFPDLSADKVQRFCARPDAPAWIIAPTPNAEFGDGGRSWRAPALRFAQNPAGGPMVGVGYYAVLPCAFARSPAGGSLRRPGTDEL